jgi:hypothetical protein
LFSEGSLTRERPQNAFARTPDRREPGSFPLEPGQKDVTTVVLVIIIALVSSGMLFVILKWMGIIGSAAVAEIEEETKPPK